MKKLYLFICLSMFVFAGCGDKEENHLEASHEDVDWFVIKDNPNDELQHLAYQIYEQTNMAIFWSDTIGFQERVDHFGNIYPYYEVLNIAYTVFGDETKMKYGLSKNQLHIKYGLEFLREYVIPRLLKHTHPKCFLLTDTITRELQYFEDKVSFNVHKAMRTTLVACRGMDVMTKQQKERLAREVIATEYTSFLVKQWDDKVTGFYELALYSEGEMQGSRYEKKIYIKDRFIPWEEYGFLNYNTMDGYEKGESYICPAKTQDVCDYVIEVLAGKETEFIEKYKDYELCQKKYRLMKKLVEEMQTFLKE